MKTKTITQIGMREFLRNMKDIKSSVLKGEEFEVLDHATPVFRVVPAKRAKNTKFTFADLSKFQFADGDKTMATDVDTLVYGN
ncbi:MAG TPA: hypothetical protein PKA42_01520 [Candidatus Paceibacterota bacterium]|nr:hypothetical protein [Candidatus Paceibacterota bacterium]HMO82823.1 hypothetical protein [Candidatus Paceibacterota bacterium]